MKLEELLAHLLSVPVDRIDDDTSRRSLPNWNSLCHVELIIGLEDHYHVKFTRQEIYALSDVREIRAALRTKGVAV
jgi:acyl carrier protein